MTRGVKSKEFGAFWKSMMMVALCFPDKIDKNNKEHILKIEHFKMFYDSLQYVIPCYFCREYIKNTLTRLYPLKYTGRIELMKGIYTWKKMVSNKLILQNCKTTKKSPPFPVILKRYEKLYATCDKNLGKCV